MQAHTQNYLSAPLLKKLLKNVFQKTKWSEPRRRKTSAAPMEERDEGSLQDESERKSQHGSTASGRSTTSQNGSRELQDSRRYVSGEKQTNTLNDSCDHVQNHVERHFIELLEFVGKTQSDVHKEMRKLKSHLITIGSRSSLVV